MLLKLLDSKKTYDFDDHRGERGNAGAETVRRGGGGVIKEEPAFGEGLRVRH